MKLKRSLLPWVTTVSLLWKVLYNLPLGLPRNPLGICEGNQAHDEKTPLLSFLTCVDFSNVESKECSSISIKVGRGKVF